MDNHDSFYFERQERRRIEETNFRRQFSSQKTNKKSAFKTNTIPSRLNRHNVYNSSIRQDIIRNVPISFSNQFLPEVHSTPVEKNKSEFYQSQSNFFDIPTISRRIDMQNCELQTATSTNPIVEGKVIKKRGVRGISWILRLAIKDNTVGKIYRTQIGWVLLCLVIVSLLGSLLAYYSKYLFTYHFVLLPNEPKIYTETFPNIMNDTNKIMDFESIMKNYTDIDDRLQAETESFSSSTTESARKLVSNDTKNQLSDICKDCRILLDICMVEIESGIPKCNAALDINDPTGCGGLCALEVEACRLLHHNYSIYACKPIDNHPQCKIGEWRCKNKFCISKAKRCDGVINCYDGSDETECEECDLAKNFHCENNTSCMENSKKCNGIIDCWDGSDEHNCTECPNDQYTCNSGECISLPLFCDGFPDCKDKTDEPIGCKGKCGKHEFECDNSRCIPKYQLCNGTDNCKDNSDEVDC